MTPAQMRALAEEHQAQRNRIGTERYDNPVVQLDRHHRTYIALRAAADQLEAVRIWNQTDERKYELDRDWLDAILDGDPEAIEAAADTAPQETGK